jgi:hypothetical protein
VQFGGVLVYKIKRFEFHILGGKLRVSFVPLVWQDKEKEVALTIKYDNNALIKQVLMRTQRLLYV